MHNEHALQSAVAILPCSRDSGCIGVIHCTTLNKAFYEMFLPLPIKVTSRPPVLLLVDAAAWVDSVVSHLPTYSVNTLSVFEAKTVLCFCSDRLFYYTLSLAPSDVCSIC